MPNKNRKPATRLEEVLIPGRFLYAMDPFFSDLYGQITRAASLRALARKKGPHAGIVTLEDLIEAAREVLPASVDGFASHMTAREGMNVRRKTA